jgi:hypothetical protein
VPRRRQPEVPEPEPDVTSFTPKERLFVSYFLGKARGNKTQAARLAGYTTPHVVGFRLYKKANIRAAIEAKLNEVALSADEVLAHLAEQAEADIGVFLDVYPDGTYRLDLAKAKRADKLRLVRKLTPTKFGISIELHDSHAALALLGKYHGLFEKLDLSKLTRDQIDQLRKLIQDPADDPGGSGPAGEG